MNQAKTKDLFNLSGKTALITGGRRGLGKAMALGLAAAGVDVAVIAAHEEPEELRMAIENKGVRFYYKKTDLSDRNSRVGIVEEIASRMGSIDILINNAGHQNKNPAHSYSFSQWDMDVEIMLGAVLDLSQQAYQLMSAKGKGCIINIASISSFQGARNIIGYSTVKHGILGMTKCLANEWASQGIKVNAIAPGIFETDMAADVMANEKQASDLRGRIPVGRFGKPEDIVGPLIFLASDASQHVHGHTLLVDGGWMGR